jgi:hypothetical protein
MKTGTCKLCGQEKILIDKSHIIPKKFHHHTSHEIQKYFDDDLTDVAYIYSQNGREKQIQNGLYVGGILCNDCENFIGRWDNYAQKLLIKEINIDAIAEKQELTKEIQKIQNIDYKLLKLFFMSILWRSHITRDNYFVIKNSKSGKSENGQFFKEVNLGNKWELKLRTMIYDKCLFRVKKRI